MKAAGVDAQLRLGDINTLAETLFASRDWDAVVYPFTPLAPSPIALSLFVSGGAPPTGTNFADIRSQAYDDAAAAARASLGAQRCASWEQAQRAIVGTDVFPLVHTTAAWYGPTGTTFGLTSGGTVLDVHSFAKRADGSG